LGIRYSLLLGVVAALLNVIPYIGGVVAMLLIGIVVLATEPPIYVLWITLIFSFIQFVDNNIIMPKIVGTRVSINEFIAIIAVLVGSALWGIAGMFLSLPIVAILKVIFDRIDSLKEFGFLLGKDKDYTDKIFLRLPKRRSKKTSTTPITKS
ncbi:MAG: AI-2E family transporter, partial [Melioribacteraceae bacterium]|nr:AI-2E family transporter [Melioribacteraceae bacterium]